MSPFLWLRDQAQLSCPARGLMLLPSDSGWSLEFTGLGQLARHLFLVQWPLVTLWLLSMWSFHVSWEGPQLGGFRRVGRCKWRLKTSQRRIPLGQAEMVWVFMSQPQMSHSIPSTLFCWLEPSQEPSRMADSPGPIVGVHVRQTYHCVISGESTRQANENQTYHKVPHVCYWCACYWHYCHWGPILWVLSHGCQQIQFSMIPEILPHYLPIQRRGHVGLLDSRCSCTRGRWPLKSEYLIFKLQQMWGDL